MKKRILMPLIVSFLLILASSGLVYAQTSSPVVPSPVTGHIQSDFVEDVQEGIQSIKNDNDGQNNQKEIDENELNEGQQENEDVDVDEQVDQDEAQENQEGKEGQSETVGGNEDGVDTDTNDEKENKEKMRGQEVESEQNTKGQGSSNGDNQ